MTSKYIRFIVPENATGSISSLTICNILNVINPEFFQSADPVPLALCMSHSQYIDLLLSGLSTIDLHLLTLIYPSPFLQLVYHEAPLTCT